MIDELKRENVQFKKENEKRKMERILGKYSVSN